MLEIVRRNKVMIIFGILFLLFFLFFGVKWVHYRFTHAITDASFVKSDLVDISPLVTGRVKKLLVDESDKIEKGQLIALLDDIDYQAEVNLRLESLERSKRQVVEAQKNLKKIESALTLTQIQVPQQIKEAENALKEAREVFQRRETDLKRITRDYERITALYEKKVVEKKCVRPAAAAGR